MVLELNPKLGRLKTSEACNKLNRPVPVAQEAFRFLHSCLGDVFVECLSGFTGEMLHETVAGHIDRVSHVTGGERLVEVVLDVFLGLFDGG